MNTANRASVLYSKTVVAIYIVFVILVAPVFSQQNGVTEKFFDYPIDFGDINQGNADERLEPFLKMARNAASDVERGKILSKIATELGSKYPSLLSDNIIEIADLALACDLPLRDRVLVGGMKGTAIRCKHFVTKGEDLRKWRLEASKAFLAGTNDALNLQKNLQQQDKSLQKKTNDFGLQGSIPRFGNPEPDPQRLDYQNAHLEYLEMERVVLIAKGLTGNISDMYARPPYDFDELSKLLEESIDDKEFIEEILSRTRRSVSKRTERAMKGKLDELANATSLKLLEPPNLTTSTDNVSPPERISPVENAEAHMVEPAREETDNESSQALYYVAICIVVVIGGALVIGTSRRRKRDA